MDISLFKNKDPLLFLEVFDDAVKTVRNGTVYWDVPKNREAEMGRETKVGWLITRGNVSSILVDAPCSSVMTAIAQTLESPELVVLFQEKNFWELLLYIDQLLKIKFSTAPAQWGKFDPSKYIGTPQDLSKIWGVPVERIERYMVDWGLTEVWVEKYKVMSPAYKMRGQKAYQNDEFGYGELYQGYDFVKALGGTLPQEGKKFFVHLPPPQRINS